MFTIKNKDETLTNEINKNQKTIYISKNKGFKHRNTIYFGAKNGLKFNFWHRNKSLINSRNNKIS
jgi:hypothetical protein